MNRSRLLTILVLFLLGSIFLTACSGAPLINSWPGVNADQTNAYVSYSSHVYAVKLADGTMAWRFPADAGNAKAAFYARPMLIDGQVIVGDYANVLHSLDATTGAEKWSFTGATDRYVGPVQQVGNLIVAPSTDHHLYALNAQGQLTWKFTAKQGFWAQPVTDGSRVYAASLDHFLYAIDPSNGSQLWATDLGAAIMFSLEISADGKTLYAGTLGSEMIAVDAATGNVAWRAKTAGSIWARPVLADGMLYFGDQSGKVTALSAADGSQKWQADAGAPVIAGGALVDKLAVFPTESGGVQAFDSGSGAKGWNFPVSNGKLYSSPSFTGERLLVAVTQGDNLLVALNASGAQSWPFVPPK